MDLLNLLGTFQIQSEENSMYDYYLPVFIEEFSRTLNPVTVSTVLPWDDKKCQRPPVQNPQPERILFTKWDLHPESFRDKKNHLQAVDFKFDHQTFQVPKIEVLTYISCM